MSDLKEETPVHNAEQTTAEETETGGKKTIDPSLEGIQLFYEKNKKAVNYIGGGLLVLVGAFIFFKLYYLPEKEKEAANELFWAEDFFEKDSFNVALKGGLMVMSPDGQKPMMGFEQVAEEYGITRTGNLANYYAGICYLRTGKFEQAIECLAKYDGDDDIVAPMALGAIGDSNMELGRGEEAVKYYVKAADKSHNSFTTPYFLKKAGFAYELNHNYTEALNIYDRLKKEYPKSSEGQEVDRSLARVRALGNL